jgi:hypothetical protein
MVLCAAHGHVYEFERIMMEEGEEEQADPDDVFAQ